MAIELQYAEVTLLQRAPRLRHYFDYAVPNGLPVKVGDGVEVLFRKTSVLGIVTKLKSQTTVKVALQPINKVVAVGLVTPAQLKLSQHVAEYYGVAWGASLELCVPVRPGPRSPLKPAVSASVAKTKSTALKPLVVTFDTVADRVILVQQLVQQVIKRDQQVLVLVPEVNYLECWQQTLGASAIIYRADLKPTELRAVWQAVQSGEALIIIGTRAALFLPYQNLGGIIIDYAANANYKQWDQNPRYDSLAVAEYLANIFSASLAYISPAPPIELWQRIERGEFTHKVLAGVGAQFSLIDRSGETFSKEIHLLSLELEQRIDESLQNHQPVYLYLNRYGTATAVMCTDCKYISRCTICKRPMVWNSGANNLNCYHCNTKALAPVPCPQCHGIHIKYLGGGVSRLAQEVRGRFLEARVVTIEDTRGDDFKQQIDAADIVIGSRAVWRWVDFTRIGLVGMVEPDTELMLPEFNATEELWQTIRYFVSSGARYVVAQTYRPEHYVWQGATTIKNFYQQELPQRVAFKYPPYKQLLRLTMQNSNERECLKIARIVRQKLEGNIPSVVELVGPYPDYYKQVRGRYRFHILVKYPITFDPTTLWPLLPDEVIIDRNPISVLS